ncbi:MAG: hypothetical protein QXT45_06230 [Candidatus Bilamarchaeaceae archaeon]
MAWKEYYIYNFEALNLPSGNGNAFTDVVVRFDSDADFEVIKRSHIATDSRIRVRFQDDSYGRQFQNTSLDLRGISGTILFATGVVDIGIHPNNFIPYILPRPYLIRAGTTYTTSFADFSGSGNAIRMSFHGAKLRIGNAPWAQEWKAKPPYDYGTGPITIAGNQTASVNISIQIDSHFLVEKIVGTRSGPALVSIKDGAVDRQWMNSPVHIDNLVGNSQFPNILPAPRLIARGSTINITIQNLMSTTNVIELIFSGLKLF